MTDKISFRSVMVIPGPPRPGDQWPGPRPPPRPPVVGDIVTPKPEDTHYACPYVSSHIVSAKKFRRHAHSCRVLHDGEELKMCPFNGCHEIKVRYDHDFKSKTGRVIIQTFAAEPCSKGG